MVRRGGWVGGMMVVVVVRTGPVGIGEVDRWSLGGQVVVVVGTAIGNAVCSLVIGVVAIAIGIFGMDVVIVGVAI